MFGHVLTTEATEVLADPSLWTDWRFLIPTGLSLLALAATVWFGWRRDRRGQGNADRAGRLEQIAKDQEARAIEQEQRAKDQEQRAVQQDTRSQRQDDIVAREVATQLRVEEDFPPTVHGLGHFTETVRQGIIITNHHSTLTFTGIDVVVQTDDVPAAPIKHLGVLPPGESVQVFCDPEVHVRVVYKADHAGQWEIIYADIDPEWRRISSVE